MRFIVECTTEEQDILIRDFTDFAHQKLGIFDTPITIFTPKTGTTSFGSYRPADAVVIVAVEGRHTSDVLRTLAHELVHHQQFANGKENVPLEELEYEANAVAGMLMREFNKLHPEMFDLSVTPEPPADIIGDSLGATSPDTTRPSGPINMAEEMGVGGGAVAGIGIGPQGEPGVPQKKKKSPIMGPVVRRKTFNQLREELS